MNKKTKFWLQVAIGLLIGGAFGWWIGSVDGVNGEGLSWQLRPYIWFPFDLVFFALAAGCIFFGVRIVIGLFRYRKLQPDPEQADALYSPVEILLGKMVSYSVMMTTFGFCMLFLGIPYQFGQLESEWQKDLMGNLLIFSAVLYFISLFLQFRVIHLHNQHTPKKAIDLYDTKATSDYEKKLDEAEQRQLYESGYAAFMQTKILLNVLVVVLSFYSVFFEPQMIAILVAGLILISHNLFFLRAANRISGITKG